jgi:hypothetical protein
MSLGLADSGAVTATPLPEPVFTLPSATRIAEPDKLTAAHLRAVQVPLSREKSSEKHRPARIDKAA